jgi:hypothetical protein
MFFLAFQPEYIHYDAIFKQYPYEVFFGLALIYGAERVITRGNLRDRLLFAATSVAGVFFATPLVHFYPVVFCVLIWNEWKRSKRFPAYSFGVACASLAASLADYWIFLKPENSSGLTNYWAEAFVPGGSALSALPRLAGLTFEIFRQFLYHPSGVLGRLFYRPIAALFLILAVVGCVRLLKERRPRFVIYAVAPLLILAAYSVIKLWPFGASRVNLFYFPLLMIVAAIGASFLWERMRAVRGAGPVAAALLAVAFLVPYLPVRRAREFFTGVDQLRTPLSRLLPSYRPGDVVLTRDTTHQIFLYYSRHYAPFRKFRKDIEVFNVYHPWVASMVRRPVPKDGIYAEVQRHFRTHQRVWIVFKWDLQAVQEESAILKAARLYGRQRWADQHGFYKVLLFLPRRDPGPAGPDALSEPEDPEGAPEVVLPDNGVEGPDPADDEPGAEIE